MSTLGSKASVASADYELTCNRCTLLTVCMDAVEHVKAYQLGHLKLLIAHAALEGMVTLPVQVYVSRVPIVRCTI